MTSRERVAACLRHTKPDRVPIHEAFWAVTVQRWQGEGLPAGVSAEQYFGLEIGTMTVDNSFAFETEVLSSTDDYITVRDNWGDVRKDWKDRRSTPELIDFPIKTRAEWD